MSGKLYTSYSYPRDDVRAKAERSGFWVGGKPLERWDMPDAETVAYFLRLTHVDHDLSDDGAVRSSDERAVAVVQQLAWARHQNMLWSRRTTRQRFRSYLKRLDRELAKTPASPHFCFTFRNTELRETVGGWLEERQEDGSWGGLQPIRYSSFRGDRDAARRKLEEVNAFPPDGGLAEILRE